MKIKLFHRELQYLGSDTWSLHEGTTTYTVILDDGVYKGQVLWNRAESDLPTFAVNGRGHTVDEMQERLEEDFRRATQCIEGILHPIFTERPPVKGVGRTLPYIMGRGTPCWELQEDNLRFTVRVSDDHETICRAFCFRRCADKVRWEPLADAEGFTPEAALEALEVELGEVSKMAAFALVRPVPVLMLCGQPMRHQEGTWVYRVDPVRCWVYKYAEGLYHGKYEFCRADGHWYLHTMVEASSPEGAAEALNTAIKNHQASA